MRCVKITPLLTTDAVDAQPTRVAVLRKTEKVKLLHKKLQQNKTKIYKTEDVCNPSRSKLGQVKYFLHGNGTT